MNTIDINLNELDASNNLSLIDTYSSPPAVVEINNNNYMVNWYRKNKLIHLENLKKKSVCECGVNVSYGNKLRHLNTSKHKKMLEKNKTNNN